MQCACVILSSVDRSALQYISTLSYKLHDSRKKKFLNTKCVFWFSLQFWTISYSKNLARYDKKNVKCPSFLTDFKGTWIFSTDFSKNTQILISPKSVQWEPCCSVQTNGRMDGQRNMTKQIGRFGPMLDINTSDGTQQVASPSFLPEDRKTSNCRKMLCL